MVFWSRFKRDLVDEPPRLALILGDRGSGKSNLALLLGELYMKEGIIERVYVALPAGEKEPREVDDNRYIVSTNWLDKNIADITNAYVLLDEGLIALNSRARRNSLNNKLIKISAVARHRSLYMSITSQAHRVDVQLRELADAIVVKKTSLARTLVLDKVPKRLVKVDKALRRSIGKSLEDLDKHEGAWIGVPATEYITNIPRAKHSSLLDKRAKDAELTL